MQELKENSEKLKSSIQKKNAPMSTKKSGKASLGKSAGNASTKNVWVWLQNYKVILTRKKSTKDSILLQKLHSYLKKKSRR